MASVTELRVGQFSVGIGLLMGAVELIYRDRPWRLHCHLGKCCSWRSSLWGSMPCWLGWSDSCAPSCSLAYPMPMPITPPSKPEGLTLCVWLLSCWMIFNCLRAYTDGLLPQALVLCLFYFHLCRFYMDQCRLLVEKRVSRGGGAHSWRRLSLQGLGSLLSAIGIFLGSNRSYGTSKAIESDPDILLITIDTLRRDHISAYHSQSE